MEHLKICGVCGHLSGQHLIVPLWQCVECSDCPGYSEVKVPNKFGARRTEVDGFWFSSKLEANRYLQLSMMEKAGEIKHLSLQPKFPLVVNGDKIAVYIADFEYIDCRTGAKVVEDTKGFRTREYKLKKKLVRALYSIEIQEVGA